MPAGSFSNLPLAEKILEAFDTIAGLHPGHRPVHAKGVMCAGTFTPTAEAAGLTRASARESAVDARDCAFLRLVRRADISG